MRKKSRTNLTLASALALVAAAASGACSAPPTPGVYVQETEALKVPFTTGDVAPAIAWSCGTLDCHGSLARNMRIYGQYGLRMALNDTPGGMPITDHEIDADFRSVSGLEPEIMNQVVADGGAHPERLTLIRKARGTEHHKGGALWSEGDPQDLCVTSWLAGHTDEAGCVSATRSSF